MHSFYLDAIRNFEGFTPQASWDYAQFSNGYGTRARFAGEVIDRAEAERRFQAEVSSARSIVERAAPDVDEGTKAALTSLTYNAGTAWIGSGLGEAIRSGDLDTARDIFLKYNKAGGEVLPGLVNRRAQEALWIGNPEAASGALGGTVVASAGDAAKLPPVVVERDQSVREVAEMLRSHSVQTMAAAGQETDAFKRTPRSERVIGAEMLSTAAQEALATLVGTDKLAGVRAEDMVRLAQLGRGSELATGSERDRQDETRRV